MFSLKAPPLNKQGISGLLCLWILCCAIGILFPSKLAASRINLPSLSSPERIDLTSGKTVLVKNGAAIKRVYIADPDVAKVDVYQEQEMVLTGKAPGTTTLTVWQNGKTSIYDIRVKYDVVALKEKLRETFPEEKELRVQATGRSVSLSGRISGAAALSEAMEIAKAYAPGGKVNNFVQVGGVHQVMLKVRVAEMSRNLMRAFGINLTYLTEGSEDLFQVSFPSLPAIDSPTISALSALRSGTESLTSIVDILNEEGLVEILAKPNLIALSGNTASFLAGGEFPVPVQDEDGITIEYKDFGVGLTFTPKVLDRKKINMQVQPEVSQLDFSSSVSSGGVNVPGLSTRRVSTTVELSDGQSFAIAGLLQKTSQNTINKVPWLGDIPVLGNLFKSRSYQRGETELVIIITPHLVKPLNMAQQELPNRFREPTDTEFFILGLMQGRDSSLEAGRMDGDFGHVLPDM